MVSHDDCCTLIIKLTGGGSRRRIKRSPLEVFFTNKKQHTLATPISSSVRELPRKRVQVTKMCRESSAFHVQRLSERDYTTAIMRRVWHHCSFMHDMASDLRSRYTAISYSAVLKSKLSVNVEGPGILLPVLCDYKALHGWQQCFFHAQCFAQA